MIKAVQQFMLGTVLNNEMQARQTLTAMKETGYGGIELCSFMIRPISPIVRLLTQAAGAGDCWQRRKTSWYPLIARKQRVKNLP